VRFLRRVGPTAEERLGAADEAGAERAPEWQPLVARVTGGAGGERGVGAAASERLSRIERCFGEHDELLRPVREAIAAEAGQIGELLARRQAVVRRVLEVLHVRLRAVREYVGAEEANLAALEGRFADGGMEPLARAFAPELELQRERIARLRRHADEQQEPLLRLVEAERDAIELTLATLDGRVGALEEQLAAQREQAAGLLAAMRAEPVAAAWRQAARRQAVLEELAQAASIDPVEIARRLDGADAEREREAVSTDAAPLLLAPPDTALAGDGAVA
jgi:hypothetical protein